MKEMAESKMTFSVRDAQPEDMCEVIRLCEEHALYEKAVYDTKGKAEKLTDYLFSRNPRAYCILAISNDEIMGYATYSFEFSTWDAELYCHLDCLFVKEKSRSLGVGEMLVKEVAKRALLNHVISMQWQTPVWNSRAIKFYHRIGALSKEKIRMYMDRKKVDELINIK